MKCSLGISNFLEDISSLSHSIVFLYFFSLITEEGFLISPCYSLDQFLGWEDPPKEEMATRSSILAWRIPWTEERGGLQSMGSQRVAK